MQPKRYVMSTGGHGSADNDLEDDFRLDCIQRWCDRFVKGIANGIDIEPFAELALPPASASAYASKTSVWQHRLATAWPPVTAPASYWLRNGNALSSAPPAAAEGPFVVRHRVQAGYDVLGFLADNGLPAIVLPKVPHTEVTFDLAAAAFARELHGQPVLECDVQSPLGSFQLAASLWALPPNGAPRWVTMGAAAVRQSQPGVHRLRIELEEIPLLLPAGWGLRLSVHNMAIRYLPTQDHFLWVPDFTDADLQVLTSPSFAARLDLPLRAVPELAILPRLTRVGAAPGIAFPALVDGTAARAGRPYAVVLGASGIAPGIYLYPAQIWLNVDAWTLLGLTAINSPVFASFAGVLDQSGQATATFAVPAAFSSALAGSRFELQALELLPGQLAPSTAPATLVVDP